jgi:hypothetical protein
VLDRGGVDEAVDRVAVEVLRVERAGADRGGNGRGKGTDSEDAECGGQPDQDTVPVPWSFT